MKWQESLSDSDVELGILEEMAQMALIEDREGKTEEKEYDKIQDSQEEIKEV